jgi:hypothetical protein
MRLQPMIGNTALIHREGLDLDFTVDTRIAISQAVT